ncbi:MAG TPA: hypothetical protein VFD96_02315 [Burkholderiaceae bacterium]|nr:hypothetical protein [Burkholderiaceae bacterium]
MNRLCPSDGEGVECQVDFLEEDLFDTDLSPATVVTMYLLESIDAPACRSGCRFSTAAISSNWNSPPMPRAR